MDVFDGIILIGFLLIVIGASLLWSLAVGLLVAGICLVGFGFLGARARAAKNQQSKAVVKQNRL